MLDGNQLLAQLLCQFRMWGKIDAMLLENPFVNEGLQQVVDVVAAQVRVAVGRKHLIDVAFAGGDEFEHGNVEGAAAEIVNGHVAALFFMQAVSQGRRRWLVDQPQNLESREFARVLGGLALRVVEVSGHGDDRTTHALAKMSFRPVFQLAQNKSGNFRWCKELIAQSHANRALACRVNAERKKP